MMRIFIALLLIFFNFSSIGQNKELKKLYSKGKYDKLIEKAHLLLSDNSNDPNLNSILGRAYTESKMFDKAIPYLNASIANEGASVETISLSKVYLAKCLFTNGKKEDAVKLLKECQKNKGSRESVRYANKYLSLFQNGIYYKSWKLIENKNIRYHVQDIDKLKNLDDYIKQSEINYDRIISFFDILPSKKVDVYIWSDRNEAYRKLNRSLACSNSDLNIVNVYMNDKKDYELSNMLCQKVVNPKFKSMLINKGLGVYFDTMDKNLFSIARKRIPKEKFSLLELWQEPTRYERNLSHPVGAAFIEFLINKGGNKKLKEFLKVQTIENAQKVYPDFDQMVKTFEAMLMRS